jgi:TonB family protein
VTAITDEHMDLRLRPDQLDDEFEIDPTPIWPADDDRLEPIFLGGPLWFCAEELDVLDPTLEPEAPDAPPAEVEGVPELDPERAAAEPDKPPPAPRQRASAAGLFGSLGVHLLPLLVLIGWSSAPAELPPAIPVQFVVAEAPSGPVEAPPDQLITETISETRSNSDNSATDAAPPAPARPPPLKTASVRPPSKPSPPPEPAPRKPVAATPPAPAAPAPAMHPAPAAPAPEMRPGPAAPAPAMHPAPGPSTPAPREARTPGPDPARSNYFDRLVALTRAHLDMLPRSFLAGRRGQTILSIVVFEDGRIGRISLKRSSGYPDIDTRIEQIVAAVGHFPPLPASFQRPSVELDFDLTFPNALER